MLDSFHQVQPLEVIKGRLPDWHLFTQAGFQPLLVLQDFQPASFGFVVATPGMPREAG